MLILRALYIGPIQEAMRVVAKNKAQESLQMLQVREATMSGLCPQVPIEPQGLGLVSQGQHYILVSVSTLIYFYLFFACA